MAKSNLIYFCVDNQPREGRMYPWFNIGKNQNAFCPFLKKWEKCFCIIDQKVHDKCISDYYDNEKYIMQNNLDESLTYKYAINLWQLKQVVVSHYEGVKVEFIDKHWNSNTLELWEWDGYEEKYWAEFLSLLLSCRELWDISIMFWRKSVAILPWLTYVYKLCHTSDWEKILKKDPDIQPESWPCDELNMYNDWKRVEKLSREELEKMYWIKIDELHGLKVRDWRIEPKIIMLEKKEGVKFSYPHADMYID